MSTYNFRYLRKEIPLFGAAKYSENVTIKTHTLLIADIDNKNNERPLHVAHIIRNKDLPETLHLRYGKKICTNFDERLIVDNGTTYYESALGDRYQITNNYVNGMNYTTSTPGWVNKLPLYSEPEESAIRWLISGNTAEGFDDNGFLKYFSDELRRLYIVIRTSDNAVSQIADISGDTWKTCYYFMYHNLTEDGDRLLAAIDDKLFNKNIIFNYSDNNLISIEQEKGGTYYFLYDSAGNVTKITYSEGYEASIDTTKDGCTIKVKSTLTKIPAENDTIPAEYMSTSDIAYSGNNCSITDADGNRDIYTIQSDGSDITYIREEHGVVTQAYKNIYSPFNYNYTSYADRDCLYKPYANFIFTAGETINIILNSKNLPTRTTIQNRKIAVQKRTSNFSIMNGHIDYTYDDSDNLLKEMSYMTLSMWDGSTRTYNTKVTYEYENGLLKCKTTEPQTWRSSHDRMKEYINYTFNTDGSYAKSTSAHRNDTSSRRQSTQTFDSVGRILSEKDPLHNFETDYFYITGSDLIHRTEHPAYPDIYYQYDENERMTKLYYTYSDGDGNETEIANQICYESGETINLAGNDEILFTYDEKRRIKSISIEGNAGTKTFEYMQTENENIVTTTNENGESVKSVSAKNGAYDKIFMNGELQITYTNRADGQISVITDSVSDTQTVFLYDELGQRYLYAESKNNAMIKEELSRDVFNHITQSNITGQVNHSYSYSYNNDVYDMKMTGMTFNGLREEIEYDSMDRVNKKKLYNGNNLVYTKDISYRDKNYFTTDMPARTKYTMGNSVKFDTEYNYLDSTGQLRKITHNGKNIIYNYDNGKLRSEHNELLNKSLLRSVDDYGNISLYTQSEYKENHPSWFSGDSVYYTYSGDRMTKFGNQTCVYDAMGNPITYLGKTATWKGRQLTSFNGVNFTYDGRGRRTSKNSITFLYDSQGRIIKQSNGLEFFYDYEGIAACRYNDQLYLYITDGQGNVIALIDTNGNEVVQYWYDAWGNHKVVDSNGNEVTSSTHLGSLNPFRYRGYYYDVETGLYFLQTSYYDPVVGRLLNRDAVNYADPQTINGLNLYAYCLNNPVEYVDPTGRIIISFLLAGAIVGFTVSFTSSAVSQAIMNNGQVDWGIATIDGLFGAVSGALATITINPFIGAVLDAGLAFANEIIVTGVQNDWQYSKQDMWSAIISSLVTLTVSYRISNTKIGFSDSFEFINAKVAINKFNSKIARNAYKYGAKSIKTASKHVNNLILKSFISENALLSYANTFILSFL